jgi:glycosyltransferase involved in cell wall biosynthesis
MKILYIAPVKDFSGYAAAARGYINALHKAGANLVVRAIRYDRADSGSEYKPTAVERELLRKPITDIDVVIQHTTPNEMRPVAGKINIAVVAWETTRIPQYWVNKLNQFNAVMTFCDASVQAFKDCGVTVPIFKIPHTFDVPSYTLDGVEEISSESAPGFLKNRFVFYNISQLSTKKGIDALLKAYFLQFHGKQDEVVLILKTYIDMANRSTERQRIQSFINSIKAALRLEQSKYPPVMVINNTLTEHQIKKLHRTGDCYVCSSRAEGWCIPAFEALAYGKQLVTTTWGGMGEFAVSASGETKNNVFKVDYLLEPLVGQAHGDPELYTAKDLIAEPSVTSMMNAMDMAFTTQALPKDTLMEFDHSVVGPSMLEMIGTVCSNNSEVVNV